MWSNPEVVYPYAIDAHLDLGGIVLKRHRKGQKHVIEDLFLEDFRRAKVKVVVAAIFVETDRLEMALSESLQQIQALKEEMTSAFQLIYSRSDLESVMKSDKIGIILSLEGLAPIGHHLNFLDMFYTLGVRLIGLTWSRRNYVADGSYFNAPKEGIKGGLTPLGINVLERAEQLGLIIDVSHLNDQGLKDVLTYTRKAVIASHSNTRRYNPILRNLTDEQIQLIAERGGVIGINGYSSIVHETEHTVRQLCQHITHCIKIGGVDSVGLGLDLCNLYYEYDKAVDVLSYDEIDLASKYLLDIGYSNSTICKIYGGNFLRFFRAHLPQ